MNEKNILRTTNHPNIIKLVSTFQTPDELRAPLPHTYNYRGLTPSVHLQCHYPSLAPPIILTANFPHASTRVFSRGPRFRHFTPPSPFLCVAMATPTF